MTDGRFRDYLTSGTDSRFPAPGTDTRFNAAGDDTRFPASGEDTRFHPVLSLGTDLVLFSDIADDTARFQDAAGTIPAGPGDPVGLLLDKSGKGNHLTAPSDAARPVYQTDGAYHWLKFDGVDDVLQALLTGIGPDHTAVVGARPIAVKNGNDSTFSIDASNDYQMNAGSGTQYFGNCSSTNLGIGTLNNAADLVGTDVVQRVTMDSATGEAQLAYNGAVVDSSPTYNGLISSPQAFRIAANRAGVNFLECRIYSLVMLSSAPDLSDLEQWIAARSGVTF